MAQQGLFCWLAADYEMPFVYSIRAPMSSKFSAQAMPAPGPATVRLALVRTGIELFGFEYTRDTIFPIICTMSLYIRPPTQVALSNQVIRAYKVTRNSKDTVGRYNEAPIYREVAQALGPITIWIRVPIETLAIYRDLLMAVGYWGTADSLAHCTSIESILPQPDECIVPLRTCGNTISISKFFTCFVTELIGTNVNWEDVMSTFNTTRSLGIRHELYIWPMIIYEWRSTGMILQRCSHALE